MNYLKRISTNIYNKYANHFITIRDYEVSIQGNSKVSCIPQKDYDNPNVYTAYELIVFYKAKPVIPMAYKELFDNDGTARYIEKKNVIKVLNYLNSRICMTMEVECL